jgi:hypothetical protein
MLLYSITGDGFDCRVNIGKMRGREKIVTKDNVRSQV